MSVLPSPSSAASPSHERANIVLFAAAQWVSSIGGWMQKATVGWLCWTLTHSAGWVGALALTDVVAAVAVGPLAGAIVDRSSPFRLILSTQSLLVVQALTVGALALSGHLTLTLLFATTLAESVINAFNQPTRMTVVSLLAGRERLSQAIAMSSLAFNLARVVGPAAAGVLMLKGPAGYIFLINAVSYLAMIAAMLHLRGWTDHKPPPVAGSNLFAEVGAGFRYVIAAPEIGVVFLLAVVFCLLVRPVAELMPAVAGEVFHGGPAALSGLMSAQGVGAAAGAALMLRRRTASSLVPIAFGMGLAASATLVLFCTGTALKPAMALIGVFGAFHVICNVAMQSLAQTYADPAYRGRVMALYSLMFRSGPSLGAFLIGLAATYAGLRGLIFGAAAVAVVLIGWMATRAPRTFPRARAHAAADAP